jgi:hypothetical protein
VAPSARTISAYAPTGEATMPRPIADDPKWNEIRTLLGPTVERYTADPDNPWAIAHGYLNAGMDLKVWSGELAIDHLFARFGRMDTPTLPYFPESEGSIRIEPHPALLLKSFQEAGFTPDRKIVVQGKDATLSDHYRAVLDRTSFDPATKKSSLGSANDMPWALQAIATWAPPGNHLVWASNGVATSLDEMTDYLVGTLAKETQFLADAMAAHATFERKGQGIFRYTCGGAHLLQGTAYAVARGKGSPDGRKIIEQQVAIQFYRYPIERAQTVAVMKAKPEYTDVLLVQRLKFAGHFLETMSKLAAEGFYTPDDSQEAILRDAALEVWEVARAMQKRKLLGDLTAIRAKDEQQFLDIVGDSAHALKGLRLVRGEASVRF